MPKKVLTVCGDSWFSTDKRYPGQSFSEILCAKHDLKLHSLARSGISNFGIALQVDRAIEMHSDFVIVGCTLHDRIEIPLKKPIIERSADYVINQGLSNIMYSHCEEEISAHHQHSSCETIISESLNSLLSRRGRHNLDPETKQALQYFIMNIYDGGVKQQIDCWIMSDAARRLRMSNIPFLIYVEPLFNHDYLQCIEWLEKKYRVTYHDFSYYSYDHLFPSIFHHSPEDAKNFAHHWEQRLMAEGFLT